MCQIRGFLVVFAVLAILCQARLHYCVCECGADPVTAQHEEIAVDSCDSCTKALCEPKLPGCSGAPLFQTWCVADPGPWPEQFSAYPWSSSDGSQCNSALCCCPQNTSEVSVITGASEWTLTANWGSFSMGTPCPTSGEPFKASVTKMGVTYAMMEGGMLNAFFVNRSNPAFFRNYRRECSFNMYNGFLSPGVVAGIVVGVVGFVLLVAIIILFKTTRKTKVQHV